MALDAADLILAALAGTGVGYVSGLFGVGGGFLLVPILSLGLSLPLPQIVGSVACQILSPATTSLLARRTRIADLRLPLTLGGGLLIGIIAGTQLLDRARLLGDVVVNHRPVAAAELLVLGVYLPLLLGIGLFSLLVNRRNRSGQSAAAPGGGDSAPAVRSLFGHLRIPPVQPFPGFPAGPVSLTVLCWFALAVGFLSGLLGISGGLVLLPGLTYLLGMETGKAVQANTVVVFLVAVQATVLHGWHGNISPALVVALMAGGTAGARLGAGVSSRMKDRHLMRYFGWLLLAAATIVAAQLAAKCLIPPPSGSGNSTGGGTSGTGTSATRLQGTPPGILDDGPLLSYRAPGGPEPAKCLTTEAGDLQLTDCSTREKQQWPATAS